MTKKEKGKKTTSREQKNKAAERLAKLLESPMGAQRLGDEAFQLAQEEAAGREARL